MKKILNLIAISLILIAGTVSCTKEMMPYNGLEGVYFAVQSGASYGTDKTWPYMPYTNLEFIKVTGDQTTVNLKVMVTGPLKDYDRIFKIEINPDSTTAQVGVHFDQPPQEVVIPANSYMAYVPVVVHRTTDIAVSEKTIGLRLVKNEFFELSFPQWDAVAGFTAGTIFKTFDASLHSIRISDFIVQPSVWIGSVTAEGQETGLWGAFSRKKLELICEKFNLTYNDFTSTTTMPVVLQNLIYTTLSRYLVEQYEKHTPILEDDGRLMYLGGCPWSSYVGKPWVPEY